MYTWLPASLIDDNTTYNLKIVKAQGSYLFTDDGKKIYDAISSWWCKPLGHRHPLVVHSVKNQLKYFEHHIPANAYNDSIELLSYKLIHIFTNMDKVLYASDGSSAIEIAMKLSFETRVLQKQPWRNKFIALRGAYHGETMFTLGVCGIPCYTKNYKDIMPNNYFIDNIIYVTGIDDPLWLNCNFDYQYWQQFFMNIANHVTALIIEPIVQGANAMRIISKDFLINIINIAKSFDIHIIADEIMVGLGRLGYLSVSKTILNFEPDIVCFAKNLTAGSIPMSAVVVNKSITSIFREHNQIFHHSHTHSCNALAASVANAYLDYLSSSNTLIAVQQVSTILLKMMRDLKTKFTFITHTGVIGAIASMDLNISPQKLIEINIFNLAIQEGIYIRPINNTIYIMPPIYYILTDIAIIKKKLLKLLININAINTRLS